MRRRGRLLNRCCRLASSYWRSLARPVITGTQLPSCMTSWYDGWRAICIATCYRRGLAKSRGSHVKQTHRMSLSTFRNRQSAWQTGRLVDSWLICHWYRRTMNKIWTASWTRTSVVHGIVVHSTDAYCICNASRVVTPPLSAGASKWSHVESCPVYFIAQCDDTNGSRDIVRCRETKQ